MFRRAVRFMCVRPRKNAATGFYLTHSVFRRSLVRHLAPSSTKSATIRRNGEEPTGGFGKRFASSYGTNVIRNSVSYGLSEAFELDNHFEKSGQKNIGKRLKHVFLGSYTTRTKTGKRIPDFPFITGNYSGIRDRQRSLVSKDDLDIKTDLRDGTISLGMRFGINFLREFIFPNNTKNKFRKI